MKTLLLFAIAGYKLYISPFLPGSCRFHPTCSTYCSEAIEHYGVRRGLAMFLRRLLKCHPFHPGGYDPVKTIQKSYTR